MPQKRNKYETVLDVADRSRDKVLVLPEVNSTYTFVQPHISLEYLAFLTDYAVGFEKSVISFFFTLYEIYLY
jgi:hypothetical protein